ncbi:hypothetical protein QF046_000965 [Microbacterium sp. W4I4]|uniref:DUF6541 family protein n=1 Tax=Microbacterium sp. W4I4 TaxID=3042295 RepID=UPI0027867B7F|nr:DUF6541 family protein [Microbacterium sp. W4I4]MDQ0613324.1 hypothetical protein [Microbacterium sp. W4I4]
MTDWLIFVGVLAFVAAILYLPGLAFGAILRLKGVLLLACAPIASVALGGTAAIILGFIGLRWSLASAALCILVMLGGAAVVRRFVPPIEAARPRLPRYALWAVVLGAIIGGMAMAASIGDPSAISQSNDAVFHLNALRFIDETGSASSLEVAGMLGAHQFYPAGWHAIVSLSTTSGAPLTFATNAMSVLIAGPVWTVGVVAFTGAVSSWHARSVAFAATLAPLMLAFPYLPLQWGVLFPYALSVALLPTLLAVIVILARALSGRTGSPGLYLAGSTLGLVGIIGIGLAQPATIQIVLAGVALAGLAVLASRWNSSGARRMSLVIGVGGAVIASALGWLLLSRATSGVQWAPNRSLLDAALNALFNAPIGLAPSIAVSILALVGVVFCLIRGHRWLVAFWAVLVLLFVVAASVHNPFLRSLLLGAFYGDIPRFGALLPVATIPLAAVGASSLTSLGGPRLRRVGGGIAATALVLAAVAQGFVAAASPSRAQGYATTDSSYLSEDEMEVIDALPAEVSADEQILVNPSTGGAFTYGLTGLDAYPRTWSRPDDSDFLYLAEHLKDLSTDSRACRIVADRGYDYVLDFGPGDQTPGRWLMPGLSGFENSSGFELVARSGDASLWRITECR